jgi:hypothetical protein
MVSEVPPTSKGKGSRLYLVGTVSKNLLKQIMCYLRFFSKKGCHSVDTSPWTLSLTCPGCPRACSTLILRGLHGLLPFMTNSSTMPSTTWILSLSSNVLDGSESALWGLPWLPACSSAGERLLEKDEFSQAGAFWTMETLCR